MSLRIKIFVWKCSAVIFHSASPPILNPFRFFLASISDFSSLCTFFYVLWSSVDFTLLKTLYALSVFYLLLLANHSLSNEKAFKGNYLVPWNFLKVEAGSRNSGTILWPTGKKQRKKIRNHKSSPLFTDSKKKKRNRNKRKKPAFIQNSSKKLKQRTMVFSLFDKLKELCQHM